MNKTMTCTKRKAFGASLALSLALSLSACGGMPTNRGIESIHQPVIQRSNFTLDVSTGPGGLSIPEQRRLAGWFEALDLRYGDRIAIDDPLDSSSTRAAVEALASRHSLLVTGNAPVTPGYLNAGTARIVVTRSKATVPGCPDWRGKTDTNFNNATSRGYGCAVNGNMAAMIADPEHLIKGATGTGETTIMSSDKAIGAFRSSAPSGTGGLKASSTSGK